jgi:hypothetical protein
MHMLGNSPQPMATRNESSHYLPILSCSRDLVKWRPLLHPNNPFCRVFGLTTTDRTTPAFRTAM